VLPRRGDSSRLHGVAPRRGELRHRSSEAVVETHALDGMVVERCDHQGAAASRRQAVSCSFLHPPTHACASDHWLRASCCHDRDHVQQLLRQRAQQQEQALHRQYPIAQRHLDDAHTAVEDSSNLPTLDGQG
jgi:hypothetical protein